MGTGNVNITHASGGLVSTDIIPDRVHLKIGSAESGDAEKAYLIYSGNQARDIFGRGELVDSLVQHFEEVNDQIGQVASPVLAVRPVNDSSGSIGTVTKQGTGLASNPNTAGTPTGSRVVKLRFTKAGAHGTAEFRKSLDGGISYSAPVVTPASNTPIALDVGVTATFVDSGTPANTFQVGDEYTFPINGPGATYGSKVNALEKMKREYRMYFLHVIGEANRSNAVSVNSILVDMEKNHHLPVFAILEGRKRGVGESSTDYFVSLQDEWDPFYSDRVSIVVAEGRYIAGGIEAAGGFELAKTMVGQWRNAGTMLAAKLSVAPVNVSAGYVRDMQSLTFAEIRHWNDGYRNYMDLLHDMRLTVLKEYDDKDGIYIARDRIKSKSDSDFADIPERRRADKMHRIVYRESLPFLNQDTEVKAANGGIDLVKATMDAKISQEMEQPGIAEINSHKIILDFDKSFSRTKILKAKLTMFVANRINGITWETSFGRV
jgi:hypothetical protein